MAYRKLFKNKNIALSLVSIFLASFSFGLIIPILPFYALNLGATPLDIGIITGLWALMGLVFSPLLGNITDKAGRKTILSAGMIGYVLVYLLYGLSNRLFVVYVARAIEGLVSAAIFPAAISLISDFSSERQRGQAMSLSAISFSLGFVFGPAFSGIISSNGIKLVFFVSALISIANFALLYFNLKEPKKTMHKETNLLEKELSFLSKLKKGFLFLYFNSLIATFVIGSLEASFALFTKERLGFKASDVGLTFALVGIMVFFSQIISGKLTKTIRETTLIKTGLLLSATGFFSMFFIQNYAMVLVSLFLLVIGNALLMPPNISLITKKAGKNKGAALGLNNSFQSLGQLLGPVITGFFYNINTVYAFTAIPLLVISYFAVYSLKKK